MEEEDSRTPWRAGGLSSKNGELWLIFAENFELHLLRFSCSLERSVLVDQDSAFHFFLPVPAFLLRIWKRLGCSGLGQVFQCSGNGRTLNFACREDAKKARNVGHTKAA